MTISAYAAATTASLLMGVVMVLASFYLLFKGKLKLDAAAGDAESSVEISSYLKLSTHYPALGLFFIGGLFIGYPLYLSSKAESKQLEVRVQVQISPVEDISDVKVLVTSLGDASTQVPNSDGSLVWVFNPALRQVRVEVSAPGRKMATKIVSVPQGGEILDAGVVQVPSPDVPLSALSAVQVDTASTKEDSL